MLTLACFGAQSSSSSQPVNVSVYANFSKDVLGTIPEHATLVGQSIQTAASLADMPPNELYTDAYVEIVRQTAHRIGCGIQVRAKTARKAMHMPIGVHRGLIVGVCPGYPWRGAEGGRARWHLWYVVANNEIYARFPSFPMLTRSGGCRRWSCLRIPTFPRDPFSHSSR